MQAFSVNKSGSEEAGSQGCMEWRENAEAEGGDAMQSEIAVGQRTEDTSKPESNTID